MEENIFYAFLIGWSEIHQYWSFWMIGSGIFKTRNLDILKNIQIYEVIDKK
jgi:hypothetical protein